MKTHVTFESDAFNTTEQKPEFVNPDCFGDDVLLWLGDELRARGVDAESKPFAEDWGWALRFTVDGQQHWIGGSRQDGTQHSWLFFIERTVGLIKSLFGKAEEKQVSPRAVQLVHECLSSNPAITEIRWHEKDAYMKGDTDSGTPQP